MTPPSLHVHAVGMACPVGLTALTACAAMRAGIDRKRESMYLDDDGIPIVASMLGSLPIRAPRTPRWRDLLVHAMRDLQATRGRQPLNDTTVLVVVPPPCGRAKPVTAESVRVLLEEVEPAFARVAVHVVSDLGGGHRVIAAARDLLVRGQARTCIVCAADSLLEARRLLSLAQQHRLKTPANSDGVIPGEAAACLALGLHPAGSLAVIRGVGMGEEPGLLTNDVPLRGEGITAAARGALAEAGLAMHDVDFRVSDAAGEGYSFKEQILVVTRLLRRNKAAFPLWLTAQTLGHVGVAAGLCGLVRTTMAFVRGHAPGPRALVFAGSDGGHRVAVLLEGRSR